MINTDTCLGGDGIAALILKQLDARGWCQGDFMNPDGKICLEMAFRLAIDEAMKTDYVTEVAECQGEFFSADFLTGDDIPDGEWKDFWEAMISLIPHKAEPPLVTGIDLFNDAEDTSEEDVRLLVKHAAEALSERN